MRTMNFPHSDQQIIEMCADIVDVLSESINEDSLHALVSIFIELSDLPSGSAFTIDLASAVDVSLALSTTGTALETHSFATPSQVAFRCMQTLQSEFAITAYDSAIQYDYAFPLRVRGEALGAITLHGAHTHLLSEFTISTLQNLADIAATSIDQSRQLQQNRILVNQLQSALNSRVILEQAKGILAERMKVDFPTAFAELRSIARSSQRPIHQVAADIVHNLSHVPTSQFARVI